MTKPRPLTDTAEPIAEVAKADDGSWSLTELVRTRTAVIEALFPDGAGGGNLVPHARRELELAHLFDPDADYGGLVAGGVLDLVRLFASQGHSGGSAMLTLELFDRLARFDVLTPLTGHPAEWMEVGDGMFQSRRKSSTFWRAGEATWYDLDDVQNGQAMTPNQPKERSR